MNKTLWLIVLAVLVLFMFITAPRVFANPCSEVMSNIHLAAKYPDTVKVTSCSVDDTGAQKTMKGMFKSKNAFGMEKLTSFYCKKDSYYKCTFN